MARYLEIGTEIAQRVRSGELPAGTELPTIREHARRQRTTSSTIGRAYRYLADGAVITLADRRRARVATDGAIAAARLLEADRVFRLAGSDDPALQIVLAHVGPAVIPVGNRGSFQGLRALARGTADGAAIHLRHHSGTHNAPFARALLRRRRPHLLHLWRREQGLLVAPGNPHGATTPADLARLHVAKREIGAGTRVLLDQLLTAHGIALHNVEGLELPSHLEIALAVASGIADVGLGLRAAANNLDLDFIPLTWEPYDIALGGDALGAAKPRSPPCGPPRFKRRSPTSGVTTWNRPAHSNHSAIDSPAGRTRVKSARNHRRPGSRPSSMAERMCDAPVMAIEQLTLMAIHAHPDDFGTETYIRARDTTGSPTPEDDLFIGVGSGS